MPFGDHGTWGVQVGLWEFAHVPGHVFDVGPVLPRSRGQESECRFGPTIEPRGRLLHAGELLHEVLVGVRFVVVRHRGDVLPVFRPESVQRVDRLGWLQ